MKPAGYSCRFIIVALLAIIVYRPTFAGRQCPIDFYGHDTSCFEYATNSASFRSATKYCSHSGGHLVFIKDQETSDFINERISDNDDRWIGLTDKEDEGTFRWLDGNTLVYDNWALDQPNDYLLNEDCVQLSATYDFSWNDKPCFHRAKFICQYERVDPIQMTIDLPLVAIPSDIATITIRKIQPAVGRFDYTVNFGDESDKEIGVLDTEMSEITHVYPPGCYSVMVTVIGASYEEPWILNDGEVCAWEVIESVELKIDTAAKGEHQVDRFEVGEEVTFRAFVEVSDESVHKYLWKIESDDLSDPTSVETSEPLWLHTFQLVGEYTVTVTVSNPLSHATDNINVSITVVPSTGTYTSDHTTIGLSTESSYTTIGLSTESSYTTIGLSTESSHTTIGPNTESSYTTIGLSTESSYTTIGPGTESFTSLDLAVLIDSTTDMTTYTLNIGFVLTAEVHFDYSSSQNPIFKWTVHEVGNVIEVPKPSNVYTLSSSILTSHTELIIPAYTLKYSLFVFKFTVSMQDEETSKVIGESSDQALIKIVPSSLVARIRGGSARMVGWSRTVTMDGRDSYDPDRVDDSNSFQYKWYCRNQEDQYFPNGIPVSESKDKGCFGDGVYLSNYTNAYFELNAQLLAPNTSYVFRLDVHAPNRTSGTFQQIVTILSGAPPTIEIRCLQNCDVKVNPSRRFALTAACLDCPKSSTPRYKWKLFESSDVESEIPLDMITKTGDSGKNIVLMAGILPRANSTIIEYTLKLTASMHGRSAGSAEYSFTLAKAPVPGSCEVSPPIGYVMETEFSISCTDFEDDDIPLMYEFYAVTGSQEPAATNSLASGSTNGYLLYFGHKSSVDSIYLPVGVAENDFEVNILVKVADVYGASVQVVTSTVVNDIHVVEGASIHEKLHNITSGEKSPLQMLLKSGDTQTAIQLLNSVSSLLNVQSDKRNETQTGKEEEKSNVHEHIEIRTTIVKSLSEIPIETIEMLQQTSVAMDTATKQTTEVSEEAQMSAANKYTRMGNFLKSQSADAGGEIVQTLAESIVSGISNIMEASSLGSKERAANVTSVDSESDVTSRNVTLSSFNTLQSVQSAILVNKVVGEEPTVLTTSTLSVTLDRQDAQDLDKKIYKDEMSSVGYKLPDYNTLSTSLPENYTDIVDLELLHIHQNPFTWDTSSDNLDDAIFGLQFKISGDQKLEVENLTTEIEFFLPKGSQQTLTRTTFHELTNDSRTLMDFNISNPGTSLVVGVEARDLGVTFELYLRHGLPSDMGDYINSSTRILKENTVNNTDFGAEVDPHTWFVSSEYLQQTGTYYLLLVAGDVEAAGNVTLDLFMYAAECVYWDEQTETWTGRGCRAGPLTTASLTHCLCNHLTLFGSSFFVKPNTVNFITDAKLFLTFVDNPVVVSTVGALFAVYLLLVIWAIRQDKKDRVRAAVVILDDNDPFALYRYDVTVQTGYRRGAGTSATVTLTLYGTEGDSEPHILRDQDKIVLQRGNTDSFLVTTPSSLGGIMNIRLWHDNDGDYPEWFIGHVIVHDLETGEHWYFLCNTWLAVDFGSGMVDRFFNVASDNDLKKFKHLFITKAAKDLRDRHLWFSIVGRPPRSMFTRVQRLSCALSLLLCAMLANIMFYGIPEDPHGQKMGFGMFMITWHQLIIGIESSLIVFPINFIIVQMFRFSKHKPKSPERSISTTQSGESDLASLSDEAEETVSVDGWKPESVSLFFDTEYTDTKSAQSANFPNNSEIDSQISVNNMRQVTGSSDDVSETKYPESTDNDNTSEIIKTFESDFQLHNMDIMRPGLPHSRLYNSPVSEGTGKGPRCSCRFSLSCLRVVIGWILVTCTTLISAYYVMLYGLKYGKKRSIDWLMSMFVTVLESVLVEQPITVLLLAAFVALILKSMDEEDDGSDDIGEIATSVDDLQTLEAIHENIIKIRRGEKRYRPPAQDIVEECRQRKDHKRRIYALLREILGYVFFIFVLLSLVHGMANKESYFMSKSVENIFFNNKNYKIWMHDYSTFFNWTTERLIPGLHGDYPGFISDHVTKLVGPARFRQIRVKPDSCSVPSQMVSTIVECNGKYSDDAEDTDSYLTSWKPLPGNDSSPTDTMSPWEYQRSVSNSYWGQADIYGGDGYVAELGSNLSSTSDIVDDLNKALWLDTQTRALFLEFTLYNANSNLFCIVTLLIERPGVGGLLKRYEIMTTSLYRYKADYQLFVMACEIIYVIYIFFFMFVETTKIVLLKKKYFESCWNWLELVIILISWVTVGVYIHRHFLVDETLQKYRRNSGKFVSFHEAAFLSQAMQYLLAMLVLLGTLKLLHLLRINPRIYLLTATISAASKSILAYFGIVVLCFTAFASMSYLMLGTQLRGFYNMALAYGSLFSLMLGKIDKIMVTLNPYFAAFLIISFIILTLFFTVNLFISLVVYTLVYVRHHHEPSDVEEIVEIMIEKLTSIFFKPKRRKR
ncbi:polycystin-1-like protein 2 [Glandiceps talaboti]